MSAGAGSRGRGLQMLGEAPAPTSAPRFALLGKGFRPFFLGAAIFAGLVLPAWGFVLAGRLTPPGYLDPISWHAHEMLFGFTVAVVAGFLLTAVGNWTGKETAIGAPLGSLVALWALGRVAMAAGSVLPGVVVAGLDLAFLPALVLAIARPIVAARNKRNAVIVVAASVLWAANLAVHLDALGFLPGVRRRALFVALDVVVLLMVIVGGRVIAMFTRNVVRDDGIRNIPRADLAAAIAAGLVVLMDAFAPAAWVQAIVLGAAAVATAVRTVHWGSLRSRREPLLWILHAGHAFIPLGLALRAAALVSPAVPASSGVHALTAGAVGLLTLGMMARVALGHSGRPIVLPRGFPLAFGLVTVGALARVTAPLLAGGAQLAVLLSSAAVWSLAFLAYAVVYAPVLASPRVDGKPG